MLVEGLPPGSLTWATRNGIDPGWSTEALLLADVYAALTGQQHPSRPQPSRRSGGKSKSGSSRYAALRSRLEAQRARLSRSRS